MLNRKPFHAEMSIKYTMKRKKFFILTQDVMCQKKTCLAGCKKVEIILEQKYVAFASPSKIWENFEFLKVHRFKFSQILLGEKNATSLCSKNSSTLLGMKHNFLGLCHGFKSSNLSISYPLDI